MPWIVRVPNADMAVCVHHILLRKDAVGDHEILDKGVKAAHGHHDPSEGRSTPAIEFDAGGRSERIFGDDRMLRVRP
jgi:hypothetical protein